MIDTPNSAWITGAALDDAGGRVPPHWYDAPILATYREIVARDPDRIMVDDGTVQLSNRDLLDAAQHLARRLITDTPSDRPLAALMKADARFAIITLACIAAGRLMVPLDAGAPPARNGRLIVASGAGAVVTVADAGLDLSFLPPDLPVVRYTSSPGGTINLAKSGRGLDAPFAIAYTSGSTGDPKGLVYSERMAMHNGLSAIEQLGLGPDDVILCLASLGASGLRDLNCALLSGARLRVIDLKAIGLMEGLRVMRESGATVLTFVPSAMRGIARIPGVERSLASLRLLELIGESTSVDDLALFRRVLPPGCTIQLSFGLTEVGIILSWAVAEAAVTAAVAPIGSLLPGRTIALFDERGDGVVDGAVGELHVSDAWLPLGYWRDGAVDDARFRPGPADPGLRSYATGDRLVRRADGVYDFAGRRDRMVKIRGLQADLGEIEQAAKGVPGVADAACVAFERPGDTTGLALFYTAAPDFPAPDAAAIRQAIRGIADHMVPHQVTRRHALPRLHNGKPDLTTLATDAERAR